MSLRARLVVAFTYVLVLVIVLPIVGAVHIITGVTSDDAIATTLIGAVGVMINAAIQIAFWVTAVFAVVEWSGVGEKEVTERWTVDKLPAATKAGRPYGETIASLVFLAVMAFLLIGQQTSSPIRVDGDSIPALDPSLWSWWIPIVLGLLIVYEGIRRLVETPDVEGGPVLAVAVANRERLRFGYRADDGSESGRHVEPHRLVAAERRWYLVAYDEDRDAWRTFRVDRIREPRSTGGIAAPLPSKTTRSISP